MFQSDISLEPGEACIAGLYDWLQSGRLFTCWNNKEKRIVVADSRVNAVRKGLSSGADPSSLVKLWRLLKLCWPRLTFGFSLPVSGLCSQYILAELLSFVCRMHSWECFERNGRQSDLRAFLEEEWLERMKDISVQNSTRSDDRLCRASFVWGTLPWTCEQTHLFLYVIYS